MDIAIVGGGIGGLTLALALHQRGLPCRVYESAPEVKELGVGITLLPHAMRELTALGLGDALARQGIENRESCFFNRFGQLIYAEPRGRFAGYPFPEVGIHRGRLHLTLWNAAVARLGAERILPDHQCVGVEQTDRRRDAPLPVRRDRRGARAGRGRRRDRLRRGQLGRAPAVLPGRGAAVRRHQHVARRHARQAVPDRPELRARRLDALRQPRGLSDRRRRGRRGPPAHQLDRPGRPAGLRPERLEQAGPARGLHATSTRAGRSTGSTCPT